jgi:hypothetical protein
MIVQISEKHTVGNTIHYTRNIECDWAQPCGDFLRLFMNTAGGSWMKEFVKLTKVISIQ